MRRLLTVSALLALAILTTAAGQPPGGTDPGPKGGDKKAEKKADPADAAIAAALARDPDVMMARAKIQLAEAELAKARLAVTQKVLAAQSAVQEAKMAVLVAEQGVEALLALYKAEQVPKPETRSDYRIALAKVEAAKAKLATTEAELKLLTGGAAGAAGAAGPTYADAVAERLGWFMKHPGATDRNADITRDLLALMGAHLRAPTGPIPDRLRAALDKPVKLGAKGEKITFEKALEVFKKDAGLDVPVRGSYPARAVADPKNPNGFQNRPIEIVSEGEELPVGAWFQLLEDNAVFPQRDGKATRFRFYVRDYGLLISSMDAAPPDAPALTDFWKQKPPEKK